MIAAARVDAFLGQLDRTRSQFYPQVDYNADASRNRASRVGTSPIAAGGGSLLHAVPRRARRVSGSSTCSAASAAQSEAAQAQRLRERAGPARRRAVGGRRASRRATSRCAHSTASSRSRGRRRRTTRIRKRSSRCATRVASSRSSSSRRSSRNTSRRCAAIPALEQQIAAQENLISVLLGRNPYADSARQDARPSSHSPVFPAGLPSSAARTPARHPAGRAGC